MRQKDIIMRQLAEKVTYFLEPVIPYLIIGSKKAAEEAGKKVGPDVWEIKKRLWEKLLSTEWLELEAAAKDVVIAPSDPEVKQVLIQEIIRSFENNPDLAREVLFLIESDSIQKIMAEDRSVNIKQGSKRIKQSSDEFNELLAEYIEKNSNLEDPEQLEIPDTETI